MENNTKRLLLFLFGCILVRLLLVYIAKNINSDYLPIMGIIALIISIGFMTIFILGLRKTGGETFGDKIWWNNLRPVHSILYGIFAFLAITKNKNSWLILLLDVIIGLIAFTFHRLL